MPNEDFLMSEEEADKLEGSGSNPGPVSPSAPPARNAMPPYFQGSLPPTQQHDVAFVGTEVGTPRIPKTALMPLPPQSNAFTNAAAQSTAIKAGGSGSGGTAQTISLSIPIIFTPTLQTKTLPGPLSFTLAEEPAGTVFAAPIPLFGGYGDGTETFVGISSDPIDATITSSGASEVALWFQASDGGSLVLASPWTNWQNNSVASINAQYLPTSGMTASYSGGGGGADYAGILVLLGSKGLPTVVQSVLNTGALSGPGSVNTGNFTSANAAGNAIIVFVSVHNVTGIFDPAVTITDTHGNTYIPIDTVQNSIGTAAIVYFCPVIGAASGNSITAAFSAGGPASVTISALEINAVLQKVNLLPAFIPLTSGFIPEINLSLQNQNGGVTGVLETANGGTGLSAPGTLGNVLTSNGTTWVSSPSSSGFTNPMTTSGDIIIGGSAGTPLRLGIGSTGQVLTVVAGAPSWQPPTSTAASFGRKVVSTTTYNQISSDIGKALDVQTASPTTINLAPGVSVPAFVSSLGFNRTSGTTSTATLSGVTLTLGDLAVITVDWYGSITDAITVADTNGNAWVKVSNTFIQNTNIAGGFGGGGQQVWVAPITSGGTGLTITATFPTSVNFPAIYGALVSGVDLTSPIDTSTSAQGSGIPSSGNITTTASNNTLVYGSVYNDNGAASGAGSGWTLISNTFGFYLNEYQTLSTSATIAATDNSGAPAQFTAAIVSLKGTAGGTLFSGFVQNNGSSTVTVAAGSGSLINGAASITLASGTGCTIASDTTNFTAVL